MTAALTVYTVVPKIDQDTCVNEGFCRARYVSRGATYVGLRQRPEDAVERARQVFDPKPVGTETHIFLKTSFTAAGFAHYATLPTDKAHYFAPVLHKVVYNLSLIHI